MEDSRNPLLPPRFCKEVFYRWKSSRTKEIITVRTDKTNKVWKQIPSEIVWENPRLWQIINQTRKVMKLFLYLFFLILSKSNVLRIRMRSSWWLWLKWYFHIFHTTHLLRTYSVLRTILATFSSSMIQTTIHTLLEFTFPYRGQRKHRRWHKRVNYSVF